MPVTLAGRRGAPAACRSRAVVAGSSCRLPSGEVGQRTDDGVAGQRDLERVARQGPRVGELGVGRRGGSSPRWRAARAAPPRLAAPATACARPRRARCGHRRRRRRRRRARRRPRPARRRRRRGRAPCGSASAPRSAGGGSSTAVISSPCSSTVSRSGSSPGQAVEVGERDRRARRPAPDVDRRRRARPSRPPCPRGARRRSRSTRRGSRGSAGSRRSAEQPVPGSRLLQGVVTSWK